MIVTVALATSSSERGVYTASASVVSGMGETRVISVLFLKLSSNFIFQGVYRYLDTAA